MMPHLGTDVLCVAGDGVGVAMTEATEDRFQALERQVSQLTQHQQSLEAKVDANASRRDAQLSQFQHQISAQMEAHGSQMEHLFRQQMASIEGLLAVKERSRSRHE